MMERPPSSEFTAGEERADDPLAVHTWLLQEQQRLAEEVGEPLFITIRLVYDGFIEVEVQTFTDRHGMAAGYSLPETLVAAVETLLYLDEVRESLFR
ncbi:MAG: hypothetical protein L0332_30355 [Chloroflexi bacterium]|nr:hypothetical protein [Chloroflexota bacterium]MCI0578068.1 hypothetical protein [Chloroflexota bacterium]MCI0646056.1 hypothetical protein [Chloroflexota bacterium]MCI0731006.1 hypothetical protein [Chloroflexota bacterium]